MTFDEFTKNNAPPTIYAAIPVTAIAPFPCLVVGDDEDFIYYEKDGVMYVGRK